jgi:hypothetical protein
MTAVPLPPRLTFQPTISSKSKRLVLQRQKREARVGQDSASFALASGLQLARTATSDVRSADVFTRLQSPGKSGAGGKVLANPVTAGTRKSMATEIRPASDLVSETWTEIKFDAAKHAFILHGFELERAFA